MNCPAPFVGETMLRSEPQGCGVPQMIEADHEPKRSAELGPVVALIVTYDRKELASRCLRACLSQTRLPDKVFIFDNGSTDGTEEHLRSRALLDDPRVRYVRVESNICPAAAFDRLLRLAWDSSCDWMWVMDDDVIPSPRALEELASAYLQNFEAPREIGFLASAIVSEDGRANNVPDIDARSAPGEEAEWGHLLGRGLVKIRWSTLCSVLIPRSTLAEVGFLNSDFYSSGVDIDFTLRITDVVPAYLVGASRVVHLRKIGGTYSILSETDPVRMRVFYRYHFRNNIYIRRKYYSNIRSILYIAKLLVEVVRALPIEEHRWTRVRAILLGVVTGLVFRPREPEPASPSRPGGIGEGLEMSVR